MTSLRRTWCVAALFVMIVGLAAAPARVNAQTILERVVNYNIHTGEFDTLIAAVLAADPMILDALSGPGPLTVFLPTDAAFFQIGLTPENVGQIGRETLTEILLYHATTGARPLHDLFAQRNVMMLNGGMTYFSIRRPWPHHLWVYINDSRILNHAVLTSNGAIYIIDQVLLPMQPIQPARIR
ncbi:fasciclin domain-containing protein [Tautonia rosea]|uniref:fasciclin domain-containing protein n=1 Tax=Tautonia rosea TaxID=2728037 RepID=UPI00147453D3|nr:fasciclin domain-containing protein [Tautonia rosea]